MRVLGLVQWTNSDKAGQPIAGVTPLIDLTDGSWREIDPHDEFPTQGQVFWPIAREAIEDSLVMFRAEKNPGQKDEFRLVDPVVGVEIVDLRDLGGLAAAGAALRRGIRRSALFAGKALIWCTDELCVGPVKLIKGPTGIVEAELPKPDRVPVYKVTSSEVKNVRHNHMRRTVLPRALSTTPHGYVDWDEDRAVLRRAVTAAVASAKRGGQAPELTKRMIDEAAERLATGGLGPEQFLERYRLEHAQALSGDIGTVSALSKDLASTLLEHPKLRGGIESARSQARKNLEEALRLEIQRENSASRAALAEQQARTRSSRAELESINAKVDAARAHLALAQEVAARQAAEAEEELTSRIRSIVDKPLPFLAEAALLKALMPVAERAPHPIEQPRITLSWKRSASEIQDRQALQRALTGSCKAMGVSPAKALRLHEVFISGLMPVIVGSNALVALASYARAVCGSRCAIVHVPSDWMSPFDLLASQGRRPGAAESTLAEIAGSCRDLDVPALAVLEGANRAPTESYLVPFLQVRQGDQSLSRRHEIPIGLRLAATTVNGPTTLPVSADLWIYAAAIELEAAPRTTVDLPADSDVPLSSELSAPGEVPVAVVDEIIDALPFARAARHALDSLGAAVARFETDTRRIKEALIEGIAAPMVACIEEEEERADALESLKSFLEPESGGSLITSLVRRIRTRIS